MRWLPAALLLAGSAFGASPKVEKLSIEAGLKAVSALKGLDERDSTRAEQKTLLLGLARDGFGIRSFSQPVEPDATERAVQWPQALIDTMEAAIFAGARGKPEVLKPYAKALSRQPGLYYALAAWALNETGDSKGMMKLLQEMVGTIAPALEQLPRERPEAPVIKSVDGLLAYARARGGGAEVEPLIKRFAAAKRAYRARPLGR